MTDKVPCHGVGARCAQLGRQAALCMRWFFLAFIALLACAGYAAILSEVSGVRMLALIPMTLFVASLVGIWRAGYFLDEPHSKRVLVVSHATLMLAAGFALALVGGHTLVAGSCDVLVESGTSPSRLSRIAVYMQSQGQCRHLGAGLAALGAILATPSIRFALGNFARRTL